jgi:hypothetical protein
VRGRKEGISPYNALGPSSSFFKTPLEPVCARGFYDRGTQAQLALIHESDHNGSFITDIAAAGYPALRQLPVSALVSSKEVGKVFQRIRRRARHDTPDGQRLLAKGPTSK